MSIALFDHHLPISIVTVQDRKDVGGGQGVDEFVYSRDGVGITDFCGV